MARVAHVVNQFFAGIGGEEKADTAPGTLDTPAGPSRGLQRVLQGGAEVAPTIYFGDNHFHERPEEARAALLREISAADAEVIVLGPAFNAGRYGLACVEIGHMIATELDRVCVTAMHPDNPAVDTYREYHDPRLFLFPTTETAAGMGKALDDLGRFVLERLEGQPVAAAEDEGYLPRGIRIQERSDRTGADRALDMLFDKLEGKPFATEVPMQTWDRVAPAAAVTQVGKAKIALVTTSGVVPWGNPDGFKTFRNTFWRKYPVAELKTMEPGMWEAVHGGYNVANMNANPLYGVPLDALRELQQEGKYDDLYPAYYVIPGNQGSPAAMKQVGEEIAAELKANSVDAALLVST
jgi:glycine reductase